MIAPLPLVAAAPAPAPAELAAEVAPPANLMLRNDTILGVCEGLGSDLGIPPNLLRIGFALALFWNALAVIGVYLGLGVLVALVRWIAPPRVEVVATGQVVETVCANDEQAPALAA